MADAFPRKSVMDRRRDWFRPGGHEKTFMLARLRHGHVFVALAIPPARPARDWIVPAACQPRLVTRRPPARRGYDHIYVGLAKMELTFVATPGGLLRAG